MKIGTLKNIFKGWQFKLEGGRLVASHPHLDKPLTTLELIRMIKEKRYEELPERIRNILGADYERIRAQILEEEKKEKSRRNQLLIGGSIVGLALIILLLTRR